MKKKVNPPEFPKRRPIVVGPAMFGHKCVEHFAQTS